MTKLFHLVIAMAISLTIQYAALGQSLSINTTGATADPTAILDVTSTVKGILIPRMDKTERNAIVTPAMGLMVFQNGPDSIGYYYFDGTKWAWIPNSEAADSLHWNTMGNTGLVDSTSFIGNIDDVPINFRINNQPVGKFNRSRSNYSIGSGAGNDLFSTGQITIGDSAGSSINSNVHGIYIGHKAGKINTGDYNIFLGALAGENNTTGYNNMYLGTGSGQNNITGHNNVAIGYNASYLNSTRFWNTAIGSKAGQNNHASRNTFIGYNSGGGSGGPDTLTGGQQTAVGANTLTRCTTGNDNTAVGNAALGSTTTGSRNVALGSGVMLLGDTASNNVGIGYTALIRNRADSNVAVGSRSMYENTSGGSNASVGSSSMYENVSGNFNTALGTSSLQNMVGGDFNTALGYHALMNSVADGNTALGYKAGDTNTLGSYNTLLGYNSNVAVNNLSNAIAIGANSLAAQNNSMVLGSINGVNGATATVNVGIGENSPNARLHVKRNGASGGSNFSTAAVIIEDNANSYLQFSHPNANETGLLSGNAETTIRSAVIFRADSSLYLRSGGNNTRIAIDKTGLVGVRTTSPLSYLDVNGSTASAITVSSASQVLDQFDHTHVITNTAGAITITLPAANTCPRREYVIVNQDNAAKTITGYLDFTGTAATSVPPNNSITLQSNGANWYQIR